MSDLPAEAISIDVPPGHRLVMTPDSVMRVAARDRAIGVKLGQTRE